MTDIDEIMDLLDWNRSKEDQQKGLLLAAEVNSFNVFFLPCNKKHCKNVWDNCAKIISSKTDYELFPYMHELLYWISDMNWPGAFVILERLNRFEDRISLHASVKTAIGMAQGIDDKVWEANLKEIQ